MSRVTREYVWSYLVMGAVVGASLVGLSCSSVPMRPVELDDARMAYAQAQQDPQVANNAPVALREAQEAVLRAEQVWDKEKDVREVQNLAAVAKRRVEVARAAAEKKQAEIALAELNAERDRVLLDARTREAQRAELEAQRHRQQVEAAKQLR
jgi:hypothetical protein